LKRALALANSWPLDVPDRGVRRGPEGSPVIGGPQIPGRNAIELAERGAPSMNAFDLSPLMRAAIGFDRMARLVETARAASEGPSYPPYNIEKTAEDAYVLTMAVAGFGPNDIEMTVHENTLTVAGKAPQQPEQGRVLYRGIAGRAFERRFVLADHIVVDGADLENGLLHVSLKRMVPEALKPRRIQIQGTAPRVIEANEQAQPARAA
jgi:molecular chaperone IbpA